MRANRGPRRLLRRDILGSPEECDAGNPSVVSWMLAGAEVSAKSTEYLIGAGSDTLLAVTRFYDAAGVLVDISDNPARGHVRQAVTSLED